MPFSFRRSAFGISLLLPCLLPAAAQDTPAQSGPTFTIKANTNIVIVDVVVTGPDGHPIHNLRPTDFSVRDNDQPQHLRSLDEHTPPHAGAEPVTPPRLPPGLFTNFAATSRGPGQAAGPLNILLLDTLNTPLRDQGYIRAQLGEFLKKQPPNSSVAIFGLSEHLSILQGFTSDPAILRAALKAGSASKASSLLNDPTGGGGDNGGATAMSDSLATLLPAGDPSVAEALANVQQFEAQQEAVQYRLRIQLTLDALNELARYLGNLPGRKNLIWFSGSVPMNFQPNADIANGFAEAGSYENEFRETTALLARSQVAIYPIDARGLQVSGTFSASSSGQKYVTNPGQVGKDEAKFVQQQTAEHDTMTSVANDTGGRAFFNTNALAEAFGKAIDDGSNYYTLTYSPTDSKLDGLYRKIAITVAGQPATLSYRRGYYAYDPNHPAPKASDSSPAAIAARAAPGARSVITRSMMRGSPTPSQIVFTLRVLPATGASEDAVAPGNKVPDAPNLPKGPYTRYAVDFAINPGDFLFQQSGGLFHDAIEFITFVYDTNGTLVNSAGSTLHADFTPAVHTAFLGKPFSYNQDISVPAKGSYFLRIAIHDLNSDRVGAVEIPVATVRTLKPLGPARDAK